MRMPSRSSGHHRGRSIQGLKEEIIRLKDEGRVLMRFNELRETLQVRLSGEFERFADEELRAVLTLLAGPSVVWELASGRGGIGQEDFGAKRSDNLLALKFSLP